METACIKNLCFKNEVGINKSAETRNNCNTAYMKLSKKIPTLAFLNELCCIAIISCFDTFIDSYFTFTFINFCYTSGIKNSKDITILTALATVVYHEMGRPRSHEVKSL